jgi:hypothetical protein
MVLLNDPPHPEKDNSDGVMKYFELPIQEVRKWRWKDYVFFIVETMYSTVLPFVAGMLLVRKQQLYWILFLVLPIYLRLTIVKNLESKIKKRIYIK